MKDERTATFHLDFLTAGDSRGTCGEYLVHYFWTVRDRHGDLEQHEAGHYGDKREDGMSEIAECLGDAVARKLRTLRPGQSATWDGWYHGKEKQILVNRIW